MLCGIVVGYCCVVLGGFGAKDLGFRVWHYALELTVEGLGFKVLSDD